jgi:hypothetical protein
METQDEQEKGTQNGESECLSIEEEAEIWRDTLAAFHYLCPGPRDGRCGSAGKRECAADCIYYPVRPADPCQGGYSRQEGAAENPGDSPAAEQEEVPPPPEGRAGSAGDNSEKG